MIFDPFVVGHHVEFLRHLAEYAIEEETHQLHFVVHPRFPELFPDLTRRVHAHPRHVALHSLDEDEFQEIKSGNIFRRALAGWEALDARARAIGADHSVFMEINTYEPALGLPRARSVPYQISGILFFPYCRIEASSSGWWPQIRRGIERARKFGQIEWVLSNPKVDRVYVLNDSTAAEQLQSAHRTDAFLSLPDPVPSLDAAGELGAESPSTVAGAQWKKEHWPEDRVHFLLFGSLRPQKGIYPLVDAVQQLSPSEAKRTALHLLGQPKGALDEELPEVIAQLRRTLPSLHVHYEDRFLSDVELAQAIEQSDVVLAPYQRTEGSSGVLGQAAKHGRPVIGPSTGLISALIQEFQLGTTVDATRPDAIRNALRECLDDHNIGSVEGMARYVRERTPTAFAQTLLSSLSTHPS